MLALILIGVVVIAACMLCGAAAVRGWMGRTLSTIAVTLLAVAVFLAVWHFFGAVGIAFWIIALFVLMMFAPEPAKRRRPSTRW